MTPKKNMVHNLINSVRTFIKEHNGIKVEEMFKELNEILRVWVNLHWIRYSSRVF